MIPKEGRIAALDRITGQPGATQLLTLHLFSNNLTVDDDTELADFVESAYNGYAEVDDCDFPDAAIDGDGFGATTSRDITFTKSAGGTGETVYGWYFTFEDSGSVTRLYLTSRFASPFDFTVDGANFTRVWVLRDTVLP